MLSFRCSCATLCFLFLAAPCSAALSLNKNQDVYDAKTGQKIGTTANSSAQQGVGESAETGNAVTISRDEKNNNATSLPDAIQKKSKSKD